jgi:hypothetical protein
VPDPRHDPHGVLLELHPRTATVAEPPTSEPRTPAMALTSVLSMAGGCWARGHRREPRHGSAAFGFSTGTPARVRLHSALPAEATPEVIAQVSEQAPKRALIRRVQGKKEPILDDATAPFPAAWRTVVIDTREDKILEGGDCELVEQFVKQIIRPLGVRVQPSSTLRCIPHAPLTGWVTLTLQTLQPYTPPVPINALQTPIGPQ